VERFAVALQFGPEDLFRKVALDAGCESAGNILSDGDRTRAVLAHTDGFGEPTSLVVAYAWRVLLPIGWDLPKKPMAKNQFNHGCSLLTSPEPH
jgi:hypothetical protein